MLYNFKAQDPRLEEFVKEELASVLLDLGDLKLAPSFYAQVMGPFFRGYISFLRHVKQAIDEDNLSGDIFEGLQESWFKKPLSTTVREGLKGQEPEDPSE